LRAGQLPSTVNTVSDVPARWTKASVYPDVWADPGEDPRNSEGASPELWVHRIEEYARHCGHADLLRECVDGRGGP
jgi:hypothetical protein